MSILVRTMIERDNLDPDVAIISIDLDGSTQVTAQEGSSAEALLNALEGVNKLGVWLPE